MTHNLQTPKTFPNSRPNAATQRAQIFYEIHGGAGPVFAFWLLDKLFRRNNRPDSVDEHPAFEPFKPTRRHA